MTNTDRYILQRYLFMTLDPVHPGAGGYRLGRVDNAIIREPGTRLPKIPGSSLHGAARAYAAYLYGTPEAAGQSQDKLDKPHENPVCYTFGYLKEKGGENEKAYSGVVNVFDARILLFPVHSVVGPVWVSTQERLTEAGFTVTSAPAGDEQIAVTLENRPQRLNLGWLMLDVAGPATMTAPDIWEDEKGWQAVAGRIVLVAESLFGAIVNSNLAVRTSVAIDPATGAAKEGALYTYEAIPRATFLTAEVVLDDYSQKFPQSDRWNSPLEVVESGLKMIEYLSVGGMGTRGFGRMRIIGQPQTRPLFPETQP